MKHVWTEHTFLTEHINEARAHSYVMYTSPIFLLQRVSALTAILRAHELL